MQSVFATGTGSSVSINADSLALARSTLSQASASYDDVLSSPLKTASGNAVNVDPEALKVIKRKFADCDDDDAVESPVKRQQSGEGMDYSSLFRRAGSGKAMEISSRALSAAKRTMAADENSSSSSSVASSGPAPFHSPLSSLLSSTMTNASAAAAAASTTPLRSTPQSSLARRRLAAPGGGQFKSPFNSPFRPPVVAASPNGFSTPLAARPTTAAALPVVTAVATPATATASPLSRMCLSSPASASLSGITPVAALTHATRNFTLRVKVTERTGSLVGYGTGGEGRFCCWLSDAATEGEAAAAAGSAPSAAAAAPAARLETEAGGVHAERAARLLQFGRVYDIHSARLLLRRPSIDNQKGLVLFIDERTMITEVTSLTEPVLSRLRHRSSLTPLSDVTRESEIDLAGIVRAISPSGGGGGAPSPAKSTPPSGGQSASSSIGSSTEGVTPSIEVTLVDQRATLTLMLSHEYRGVELRAGDLLLVYRAAARRGGGDSASASLEVHAVRGRTKMLVNPLTEDGRVLALSRWARGGRWAAPEGVELSSIASIEGRMRAAGGGDDVELATKAMIVDVDAAEEAMVEECRGCGRRRGGKEHCACGPDAGTLQRLQLEVDLSDGTGLIRVNATGAVAEELVGMEGREAREMIRWNRDEWRAQCRRGLYESRVFKLRRGGEGTPSALSIVEVLPVSYEAYLTLITKKLEETQRSS